MLQALDAIVPDYEPQLQRAESSTELNVPVPIVDYCAGFGRLIAQVFRQNTQRLNQRLAIGHPEAAAIERREHPLMWIEVVAVGEFDSVLQMAELRTQHGGA